MHESFILKHLLFMFRKQNNKYKISFNFILIILALTKVSAQNSSFKKESITVKKVATINLSEVKDSWMPVLQNLEMPKVNSKRENMELIKIKNQLKERYPSKSESASFKHQRLEGSAVLSTPIIERNFEGNISGNSVPNDNDMAISNGGKVVSVINTMIYVFDINDLSSAPWKKSLEAFAIVDPDVPKNNFYGNNAKYDPKIIYDPDADRFIIVMLNGFHSKYSKIIVAFSQTNDPTQLWSIYLLSGNPTNDSLWSDYPQIAMTREDFFITVNLLTDTTNKIPGPKPWELGFVDDAVWQMKKQEGYDGLPNITTVLYHDIRYQGKIIQYLCPIKDGSGPNMYLVSNKSFSIGNDSIFLVEVTNSLSSGNAAVNVKVNKSDVQYYVPPNASQPNGKDSLLTNDARILSGFFHNGKIQFVNNTMDTSMGSAAIYHGIIKNITNTDFDVSGKIISSSELDFGYPNISYAGFNINYGGISDGEDESIITFDHSSSSSYPGTSAVFYSNGSYSDIIEVKKGDTTISVIPGIERWGDYSGSQRKYNESGKIWMAATFGSKGTGTQQKYGTWIAELSSPSETIQIVESSKLLVFPNPSDNIFSLSFTLENDMEITINIYDARGRLVNKLLHQAAKAGQNIFSFSTIPLAKGFYFLSIESQDSLILKTKIVKS